MKLHFYKYQGTGNDFIMIDDRDGMFPVENNKLVATLCDRRFGIGADGLILLQSHPKADFYMKYYNSDGHESSMCGNGGRCIAAFAHKLQVADTNMIFEAIDGSHQATVRDEMVKLKMIDVNTLKRIDDTTFELNTGSPHFVRFLKDNLQHMEIVQPAKKIRYNEPYSQQGINVNFAQINKDTSIAIRTYERGVEDETLSCGTGVTAAAISLSQMRDLTGHQTIEVIANGGTLNVHYNRNKQTNRFTDIWLEGPAKFVFEGKIIP